MSFLSRINVALCVLLGAVAVPNMHDGGAHTAHVIASAMLGADTGAGAPVGHATEASAFGGPRVYVVDNMYGGLSADETNPWGQPNWWYCDDSTPVADVFAAVDRFMGRIEAIEAQGWDGIHFRPLSGVYHYDSDGNGTLDTGDWVPFHSGMLMPESKRNVLSANLSAFKADHPDFELVVYDGFRVPLTPTGFQRALGLTPDLTDPDIFASLTSEFLFWRRCGVDGIALDAAASYPSEFSRVSELGALMGLDIYCEAVPPPKNDASNPDGAYVRDNGRCVSMSKWHEGFHTKPLGFEGWTPEPGRHVLYVQRGADTVDAYVKRCGALMSRGFSVAVYDRRDVTPQMVREAYWALSP